MPKRKCSSVDPLIGENLAFYRKLSGLTQKQVADAISLNRSTYTKYETGASEPSLEILKRIAVVLNVDLVSLLKEDDEDLSFSDSGADEIWPPDAEDRILLSKYHSLDRESREELMKYLNQLCSINNN